MIYLDTHIIVWLYSGELGLFSEKAVELIENNDIFISSMVTLELQYLLETKRINKSPSIIVETLTNNIGLKICTKVFSHVIKESMKHTWTRDPFDRIITANASIGKKILLTKDSHIQKHYSRAVW